MNEFEIETTVEEKEIAYEDRPNKRNNDFGWESLASVEVSRQNQLISEIYSIMNTGDDAKLEFIKNEWNSLSEEGIDPVLEERFKQAVSRYETRQERLEEAIKTKKELIHKAEDLKTSSDWTKTAAQLQQLQVQWKEAGYAGSNLDQELWDKFRSINDYFFERRSKHYETLSSSRQHVKEVKEKLIEEINAIKDSTDWKKTSVEIRDLMTKWKEAGFAGREHEDALWEKFNEARQHFYAMQRNHFESMRSEHEEARKAKLQIILRAEALVKSFNNDTERESMEALFTEWKNVGHSGRESEEKLWNEFRAIQDDFYGKIKTRNQLQTQEKYDTAHAEIDVLSVRISALESLNEKLEAKISSLQQQFDLHGNDTVAEELNGLKSNLDENLRKIETYRSDLEKYQEIVNS